MGQLAARAARARICMRRANLWGLEPSGGPLLWLRMLVGCVYCGACILYILYTQGYSLRELPGMKFTKVSRTWCEKFLDVFGSRWLEW